MKQQANQGASGMLLGMAAGAALGAVGVMAATQNQRQLRRTTRKVMRAQRTLCCSWTAWSATLWKSTWTAESKTTPFPLRERRCAYAGKPYLFQMHIRAEVLISPSRLRSIWMLQVTVRALFTSLPVSTEAGRFLMVSTPVSLVTSPVTVPL